MAERCPWAIGDAAMEAYHDDEWGVPLHDDRALFELLTLEGAQAGLSWSMILKRRDAYRRAFAGFDPAQVAAFDEGYVQRLLANTEIVRNRQKIASTLENARRLLALQADRGSFDSFVWTFVGGKPLDHGFRTMSELPASTSESEQLSKALRKRGFGFVGPTICYAFMQSAGLVNDHLLSCDTRTRILALSSSEKR
jgi:DNA-3-methyladenine glycosylase I